MAIRGALYPFVVTMIAIALLSLMDGFMKSAALATGAFSALLVRSWLALAMVGPVWVARKSPWPEPAVMRIHLVRGLVIAFMALTFFSALVYLPLAEAIAFSFIAPLIALALAAIILKERIGGRSIAAALLGLAGVAIIVGGRIGRERLTHDAGLGIALVLFSAMLYAWNLILQRQQALVAKPIEIATFQTGVVGVILLVGAPFFFTTPQGDAWIDIACAAILSLAGALMLSWAYARAEAQVLVPVEYSGFAWAAVVGWFFFGETVRLATLAGAVLIILGCWIAAPGRRTELAATGTG